MHEGLSTGMEQSRKIQESYYYDRYLMSHYGLLQDDWGKKMVASGFSNVLMITCSMTKVINGKIYSQALTCQKTLTEAMFWLLFNKFIEEHELSNNLKLLSTGFFAWC